MGAKKKQDLWSREQVQELYELAEKGDAAGLQKLIDSVGSGSLPEPSWSFSISQLWDSCLHGGSIEVYRLLKDNGVDWDSVHAHNLKNSWGEEFDGLLSECVAHTKCSDPSSVRALLIAILDDGYRFVGSSLITGLDEMYAMFPGDINLLTKLDKARFPLCPQDYPPDTYGHYEYVQFWRGLLESHPDVAAFLMRRGFSLPPELEDEAARVGIADTPVDADRIPRELKDIVREAAPKASFSDLKAMSAINTRGKLSDGSSLIDDDGIAIIPDGVIGLKKGAFSHDNTLVALLIPPSLKMIEAKALEDLPKLCAVAMYDPNGQSSTQIERGVFHFGNVASIEEWPYALDAIDEYRFGAAMETISISDGKVGWMSDKRCAVSVDPANPYFSSKDGMLYSKDGMGLFYVPNENRLVPDGGTGTLVIPEGVDAILERALKATQYSHIILPQSLKGIGACAFMGAPIEDIEIPGGVEEFECPDDFVPDGPFAMCEALSKATICEGVREIPPGMFKYCNRLLECSLPSTLRSIGKGAFNDCRNLELTVPDGVTRIDPEAFGSGILSSVRSVSLPANLPDRDVAAICGHANGALVLQRSKDGSGYACAVYLPDDNDEAEARGTLEALWDTWKPGTLESGLAAQDKYFLTGKFKRFYTKIRVAIARLSAPLNLSDEAANSYQKYLDKNLEKAKRELNSYEGAPFLRLLKTLLGEDAPQGGQGAKSSDGVPAEAAPLDIGRFNPSAMWNIARDGEPIYKAANGTFDGDAASLLFAQDYVFFNPGEITWDGSRHGICGMQVNSGMLGGIPMLLANAQEYLTGIVDFLTGIEKDEGLHVPLDAIHPGLHDALCNSDLTPITLFNLQACARAYQIARSGDGSTYQVLLDTRLSRGIPDFYNLVARLIWDMRSYNGLNDPFEVLFASAVNFDANQCLEQFDASVAGAENHGFWSLRVEGLPQVTIPSGGSGIIVPEKGVAASTGWHFVEEYIPVIAADCPGLEQAQASAEYLENTLRSIIWEMPMDCEIEGTGYENRTDHIEGLKVGDPLVLAGDWQSPYHENGLAIEVFDVKGKTLGLLSLYDTVQIAALCCLLPHITASIAGVTPKSARRKNAKYALMTVHMEIDDGLSDDDEEKAARFVLEAADELLHREPGQRVQLSKGPLMPEDLKGAIDTSKAGMPKQAPTVSSVVPVSSVEPASAPTLSGGVRGLLFANEDLVKGEIAASPKESSGASARKAKRSISEAYEISAIPRIEKALNEPVSADYYVETSEKIADKLMSDRQRACDAAVSSWSSDEDNVAGMAREFGRFNDVICRYFGYLVDMLEAQVAFGVDGAEVRRMAAEAEEFSELVADRFSCGNAYLDGIANRRSPVTRPASYAKIKSRLDKIR